MSSEWGRIDPDGTVYVRTSTGERAVGSWQAGDAEAGLAYYVRRYEDLATEVSLLEHRFASGAGDAAATRTQAVAIREQLATAAAVGDLASLAFRLDTLLAGVEQKAQSDTAARQQAKAAAVASKEALVAEAERIAEAATSWKASGDRLRTIVDEWKAIKGIDRKTDEALWKKFAAARDAFGKRRASHFSQLDAERGSARTIKETMLARAQELSASEDWKQTAADLKDLMARWKAAPRAARDIEEALWTQFRAAQDEFFSRRSAVFSERDAEQVTNLHAKEAIIAEARAIDLSDARAAQAKLRQLQSQFEEVGHVPRDAMRRLDDQLRAAEQRVREASEAEWRRGSVESNPFLAQLRERLTEAEAKLERARLSGDQARITKAEADVAQRRALLPS
ncbi:MAG TPA: DUF349 domain-containing protein [Jatrophihabitantaceae bacterium]|jgi:hypothetical protein|nr:DUF349 domain-containing protein [Jatrophihabitantaceae bacterium]